jgi:serine/threonine protein kinase
VRVKRYKLQKLSESLTVMADTVRHFKRSVEVVSALGSHAHIVNTINFFPDEKRPDIYFEITELVNGQRLDEMMAKTQRALLLEEQLDYLEPLCEALQIAHNHKEDGKKRPVYHRNVSPETVFITQEKVVKLADFDFAKYGLHTITPLRGAPLLLQLLLLVISTRLVSCGIFWPAYHPIIPTPAFHLHRPRQRLMPSSYLKLHALS